MKNLIALFWLMPAVASADGTDVVYMTTVTTAGQNVETRLTGIDDSSVPKFYTARNIFKVNSVVYPRARVAGVRFDVRKENLTGIRTVNAGGEDSRRSNVYSVSGRLVRAGSASADGLPKGVYIINNKKIVVK